MIALTFVTLFVVGVASASASLEGVDPNTLQCDPAGQVFLLLPHFTDCSKFYMCTHGQEVEFSCSGGLIFDFVLQTCNWDWATECTLRTSEEDAGGDEEDEELEGSGESSGDFEWSAFHDTEPIDKLIAAAPLVSESVAGPSTTVQHSNFAAILDCHSPVGAARQVPYKGDCQRFWRCIDGLPHSAYCSDGLFFNESTQQCDFEANVKCAHNSEDELQGEFILHQ